MTTVTGWMMTEPGKPLEKRSFEAPPLLDHEVRVEVAGCGVCHTDISFALMGVKTRAQPPLVLGHEVSGTVAEVGKGVDPALKGKAVLIPAVLPCGECEACKAGHRRICSKQIMPGNDRHGGFADLITVPAKFLCPVPPAVLSSHELWELSIVSDAVTTPYQAVKRSGLVAGELAVFIGVGGIGIHGVQIARALGAKVIALDVDPAKLETAAAVGAAVVQVAGLSPKDLKARVQEEAKKLGAPRTLWKIFETSGTKAGQQTAFSLLGFGSTLAIVGFTMDTVEVRLSNLMAFDSQMFGVWGCDPVLYPEVLTLLAEGRIQVKPYVERHPLAEINEVFAAAHHGKLRRRVVCCPA